MEIGMRPIHPHADTRDRAAIPHSCRPVVERLAGWSARHRAIALVGWLFLVAGAVVIGNTPRGKEPEQL